MNTLPKTLVPFFWFFIKKYWVWFVIAQLFALTWAIEQVLFPYVVRLLVDTIVVPDFPMDDMWRVLAPILIFGVVLWLGTDIGYRVAGYSFSHLQSVLQAAIRMSMLEYVQQHSYRYFSDNLAGKINNKINDMVQGFTTIARLVMFLIMPGFLAIVIITPMFFVLEPWFAGVLILWVISHFAICIGMGKRCDQLEHEHAESNSTLIGNMVDSLMNFANVKLFANRRFEYNYIAKYQQDELVKQKRSLFYIELVRIWLGVSSFLGPGLILTWLTLSSWQNGHITVGDVVFILYATWNIMLIVWYVGMELPNLFREIGSCKQALTIIQASHDIVNQPDAKELVITQGEIVFDEVSFHYNPEVNIFEDKNLTIHAKEHVGLVGFSGAGKTTFVNLILRFFDVEAGRILIDGQDIATVTQGSLREQIAMIPQDPVLFHRSILENIRYGNAKASDEEVYSAAKKAYCHEFIEQLPQGYNTLVGERGIKLSGGQRQRIAIARAILKNAPLLILDEATSALDSDTERKIQTSLAKLMKGRTTIVVAHRLSTLHQMDRILVFKEGCVIEEGSHDVLLEQKGHYADLWSMQVNGFLPEMVSSTKEGIDKPLDECDEDLNW